MPHRAIATPLQEGFQKTSPMISALSDNSKTGSSKTALCDPLMSFTTNSPGLNPGNYKPQQLRGRSTAKSACGEFKPSFNSSFAYLLPSSLKKTPQFPNCCSYSNILHFYPLSYPLSFKKQEHYKQCWEICFHPSTL